MIIYGDKLSVRVTRDFKQLVNIAIAAGKFILIHPQYDLIREAMRLELFEDERLEDFEVHNWQFETGEVITYDFEEVLFFYSLVELSCRVFLCDIGDDLKKMAVESGETNDEEFIRVRGLHLHLSENFLRRISEIYSHNESFCELQHKIEQLNSLA